MERDYRVVRLGDAVFVGEDGYDGEREVVAGDFGGVVCVFEELVGFGADEVVFEVGGFGLVVVVCFFDGPVGEAVVGAVGGDRVEVVLEVECG